MTIGGPASSDPYPATPRPYGVRKAEPTEQPKRRQLVPGLVGVAIGVLLTAAHRLTPSGPPVWQAILPPLLPIGLRIAQARTRNRRARRALDASEAALLAGGTPSPVHLVPTWGGTVARPVNRLAIHRSVDGEVLGYVTMLLEPSQFDPRDQLWLHGHPVDGAPVALQADDDRPPMLTVRPFATDATVEPLVRHPRSDTVNRLLGWSGTRPAGAEATDSGSNGLRSGGAPSALAEAARSSWRRAQRSTTAVFLVLVGLAPLAATLHLDLVRSTALTAFVWGAAELWSRRWSRSWVAGPVAGALRTTEGLDDEEARYVAAALATLRFGLPPTAVDGPPSDHPGSPPPPEALPPGWGYPSQPYH